MNWQDISTAISRMAHPFPKAAAEEARARWDELAPHFIAEIERVADGGSTLMDEIAREWDGLFSFAVYLAAEKRDARAYRPLLRASHCNAERAQDLFGDDAGTGLGRMLASVCDGDLAPLKALAEDRIADAAKKQGNRYIGDALADIGNWICYDPPKPKHTPRPQASGWPTQAPHSGGTADHHPLKVGRNDPCPCGSGKKFKKCCGNEAGAAPVEDSKDGGG